MAEVLNFASWPFKRDGGAISFRVAGNPDTAVGVKYFLYLNDAAAADSVEVRAESEVYELDPKDLTGKVNKLGFVIVARPIVQANRDLSFWVEAMQTGSDTQTHPYLVTLAKDKDRVTVSDGVKLEVAP